MQNQDFEEMLNQSMKEIHQGEIVEGSIISVFPNYCVLNIGYKADGILKKEDYCEDNDLDLSTLLKVGDVLKVKIKKVNDGEGQVSLSRKEILRLETNNILKKAYEEGKVHKGKVIKTNAGGLTVELEKGINVFMPTSLINVGIEKNLEQYVGQELEFVITEFNPMKRRVIADRKRLITKELKEKREECLSKLKENDIIEGFVKSILDFGVFVDLGGIDGLLHITEMGWGRIKNPKNIYNIGDKIKVLIREINNDKVSLTTKFPEDNPWILARVNYEIGKTIKGTVARMTDYGAFIQLDDNIDALLHVSQIAREKVKLPQDVLKIGQEVEVKVIDFDEEKKKISVSMKALLPEENKIDDDTSEVREINIEEYSQKMDNIEE
ncbi:MAG: S1 RNA-binding domain-containing protein [Eubacteriales bacterium]|nr:S1 RNA-binding domain-containing protein [Eubacteriales bacterium]